MSKKDIIDLFFDKLEKIKVRWNQHQCKHHTWEMEYQYDERGKVTGTICTGCAKTWKIK